VLPYIPSTLDLVHRNMSGIDEEATALPLVGVLMVKHENDKLFDHFGPGRVIFTIVAFMILSVCLAGTGIDLYVAYGRKVVHSMFGAQTHENRKGSYGEEMSPAPTNHVSPSTPFEETKVAKILLCWSFYTNFGKLFTSRSGGQKDPLDCLNCVRFCAISWVVLGHVFLFR
jgi:hypothetical protein